VDCSGQRVTGAGAVVSSIDAWESMLSPARSFVMDCAAVDGVKLCLASLELSSTAGLRSWVPGCLQVIGPTNPGACWGSRGFVQRTWLLGAGTRATDDDARGGGFGAVSAPRRCGISEGK